MGVRKLVAPLASLRLTVVLFAMAIFIIFAGTVAQIDRGIWTVVNDYFRTAFAWIELKIFFPRRWDVPGGFYFPGGWLIAVMLLINLLFAHALRFKVKGQGVSLIVGTVIIVAGLALTWFIVASGINADLAVKPQDPYWRIFWMLVKGAVAGAVLLVGCVLVFKGRAGVVLLHGGIVLLIVSELYTGLFAVEATMTLKEGQSANYVDVSIEYEIAVIDGSDPRFDQVTAIPHTMLQRGRVISHPDLPFDVRVEQYMKNTSLPQMVRPMAPDIRPDPRVTGGPGTRWVVYEAPEGVGVGAAMRDSPAVIATFLKKGTDEVIGTYQLSIWFYPNYSGYRLNEPHHIDVGDKHYDIYFRNRRELLRSDVDHKPFSVKLETFHHDLYLGTNTPKNFASDVIVNDPDRDVVDRPVKIWMNNPMRYGGRVFYQAAYLDGDSGTILQVVKNSGWLVPYVSCMIVATGMLAHFGKLLVAFLRRRLAA